MQSRRHSENAMKKMRMVIGIRPEKITEYKALHNEVWPDVLAQLAQTNIRNYPIFLCEHENLQFGYWEYCGDEFEADMVAIKNHTPTQHGWELTGLCQRRLDSAHNDEQLVFMKQVFDMP
jgi:L-rhamnose mutarotase